MDPASHPDIRQITIETVDSAIHQWFDKTVDAHVEHPDGERKKVPIIFSSGERFVTSRTRKAVRDNNGVIILPLISIRRTGIEPNPSMQALGTETATLQFAKRIDGKSNNLQNLDALKSPSNRSGKRVVYEIWSIPFPDRNVMNYELVIQTQYITQMNSILEKTFHELDLQKSFVATFDVPHIPQISVPFEERKKIDDSYVVGFFESDISDGGNLEEFTDQERIVRWTTSIRVPATLQLDPEGEKPSVKVERTSFGLKFSDENAHFFDNQEDFEKLFGKGK